MIAQIIIYICQIWAHLNKHVIGQETAKKQLAVAVYNHYKRINNLSGGAKPKSRPQFGGTLLMSDEKMDDKSNISNGSQLQHDPH